MATGKEIRVGPGELGFASCWKTPKVVDICVHGEGYLEGCSQDCRYAAVPGVAMKLGGVYTVRGAVVDVESGKPLAKMRVSLIMPTNKRYYTVTDNNGTFEIAVKPDTSARIRSAFTETRDFGTMKSAQEIPEIVLFAEFTEAFQKLHPDIQIERPLVSRFTGETINV
ncbi:MAG: carboxypeptidase regulatory-like domain-containing protein [Chloroflexi bacterium]|nr:carboxypeptidase regulatory-like domain-containing protein [Chloroflexota bacterium]